MLRKKKSAQPPESLLDHPFVQKAIKAFHATVVEPGSQDAIQSPFAEPEVESDASVRNETADEMPASVNKMTTNREELLRQYGALSDGDASIAVGRCRRR
jgi:hypothetical protein